MGFSLIELLAVIAIILVMGTFAVVGFQNVVSSAGTAQAVADLNGLLEFARSEAVTRQTYTWVGVKETNVGGSLELQMTVAYSMDGTTNGGSNIRPLSRVMKARNTGLVAYASLKQETRDIAGSNSSTKEFMTSTQGATVKVGNAVFTNTITFSSRGEAMLKGAPDIFDGFDRWIGLGIVPTRGLDKTSAKEDAGIVLDGSTGMSRILRL